VLTRTLDMETAQEKLAADLVKANETVLTLRSEIEQRAADDADDLSIEEERRDALESLKADNLRLHDELSRAKSNHAGLERSLAARDEELNKASGQTQAVERQMQGLWSR
jgi:hypothetical protein